MRPLKDVELVAFRLGQRIDPTAPLHRCTVGAVYGLLVEPTDEDYQIEIRRTELSNDVVCTIIATRDGPDDRYGLLVGAWFEKQRLLLTPDEFMESSECLEMLVVHQKIRARQLEVKAEKFWGVTCAVTSFLILSALFVTGYSYGIDMRVLAMVFIGSMLASLVAGLVLAPFIVKKIGHRLPDKDEVTWSIKSAFRDLSPPQATASAA